ncbi:MAG: hypothetical protein NZ959_03035 [Armatimonadetes bacterium]|nr:hypothetical protein [Armatimonadota bacterium]MDW8121574.1 hypothetical protein [Armatimonadota bacterium]
MRCARHEDQEAVGVCQWCGLAVCSQCQQTILQKSLCNRCAEELRRALARPSASKLITGKRSNLLAFVLGLIPGIGHFYLGLLQKGLVLAGLGLLLFLLTSVIPATLPFLLILMAYSAFDSLQTARAMNNGLSVADWTLPRSLDELISVLSQPSQPPPLTGQRSGCLAFALGLIPGIGHLYLGQMQKGLVLATIGFVLYILATVVFLGIPLLAILMAYSAFDSVHTARALNAGLPVADWTRPSAPGHQGPTKGNSVTQYLGIGILLIGLLLLIDWAWGLFFFRIQLSEAIVTALRMALAAFLVLFGAFCLWLGLRTSETI